MITLRRHELSFRRRPLRAILQRAIMSKDKPQAALPQLAQESEMESQFRKAANFSEVESKLGERYSKSEMNTIDRITSMSAR